MMMQEALADIQFNPLVLQMRKLVFSFNKFHESQYRFT